MYKRTSFFILLCVILSCDANTVFSSYIALGKTWEKNEKIRFVFQAEDTIKRYNVFITIRNDENYKFNNLFLIATMSAPNGEEITDTLEYAMAKPNGEWLGKGFTAVKESKLWYKENIVFPDTGAYHISLAHAMRENGSIEGMEHLEGITEIGIKIEHNK